MVHAGVDGSAAACGWGAGCETWGAALCGGACGTTDGACAGASEATEEGGGVVFAGERSGDTGAGNEVGAATGLCELAGCSGAASGSNAGSATAVNVSSEAATVRLRQAGAVSHRLVCCASAAAKRAGSLIAALRPSCCFLLAAVALCHTRSVRESSYTAGPHCGSCSAASPDRRSSLPSLWGE